MRVESQPAYVLHARAWRETSLLLEVFSRDHGRVGLLARGVRSARARITRATLEPFQLLSADWAGTGELPNLRAAEAVGAPRRFVDDALLSGLYVNELLVRLIARADPHPALFARYAVLLEELATTDSLAWTLRRFERDLLGELGYGLQLEHEGESGEPLRSDAEYVYVPELGPVPAHSRQHGAMSKGSALLALHEDVKPAHDDLAALRRVLRAVIASHVGEQGLRAWRVLGGAMRGT
ncbi:MAG TPA: DNA repair protein RecO [Rhodanobacteraceae bacterium]|nr:DNA repair protein RecO [Rhodanobacteraceae bacterium]